MTQMQPIPAPLAQAIVAKASGNPFFLEELAWAVCAGGSHNAAVPIPDTVHAVLAARIDRLPPMEKHLLQAAAVIGPEVLSFPPAGDHAISLRKLSLTVSGTCRLPNSSMRPASSQNKIYTFKHILTRKSRISRCCIARGSRSIGGLSRYSRSGFQ